MKSKKGIIITGITLLLLLVVGVTYAFFTYESGTKSDIVTGQIYMNYEETSTISLTGVFPETKEQALARTDENGVFEFTITGRNTSKYPVYYEIDLLEGGVITGKTEQSTKILPEHVMIYLEKDGEPLVDGMTYKDWNNRRIYVDTVPANQATNIEHNYVLRMWIDENVTISDTNPDADYTTSEWNDAYTSLKVRVVGDFEQKEVATDASCFLYSVTEKVIDTTLDTSEENVDSCKEFMLNTFAGGTDFSDDQDEFENFCKGTGSADGLTLKEVIAGGFMTDEQIQALGVVKQITAPGVEITNYDETCETNVTIPSYIDGVPVISIGTEAFFRKNITSVKFPNTLKIIGEYAFSANGLIKVTIPDSVVIIEPSAFNYNNISTVEIGTGIKLIGSVAFGTSSQFVNIKGAPVLASDSFTTLSKQIKVFQYGGTCSQLKQYANAFGVSELPETIITSDSDACMLEE